MAVRPRRPRSLDKQSSRLYSTKYFALATYIQELRAAGGVGRRHGRSVAGVALARAPDRAHAPDAHGVLRGGACDRRLERRCERGYVGAGSGNEARAPGLDLVPGG